MKTNIGVMLDKMVDGFNPSPTPQDEINAKVAEMEKRLTDMIDSKLKTFSDSQDDGDAVDAVPPVDDKDTNDTGAQPTNPTDNINE